VDFPVKDDVQTMTASSANEEPGGNPCIAKGALLQDVADGLPLIVWVHDAAGGQASVNDTFCDFFGVDRAEMRGGSWQMLLHPDDADAYAAEFTASVAERRAFHAEVRVRRADGEWRWLESWASPRHDVEGTFLGMVGASADVTERKRYEAALAGANRRIAEQHAQLQAVYDSINDGLVVFDMDGQCIMVNEAEAIKFGYESAAEMTRGLDHFAEVFELSVVDGSTLPHAEWPAARALRGERFAHLELLVRRSDTGQRWIVSFSGEPVFDASGTQILAVVISRDVTQRRQRQQALRDSEERLRLAADATGFGTYDFDLRSQRATWSERLCRIVGIDACAGEVDAMPLLQACVHPDDRERYFARMLARPSEPEGTTHEIEFRIVCAGGGVRWVRDTGRVLFDERNGVRRALRIVGTVIDITAQKEEQRTRLAAALRDRLRARLADALRLPGDPHAIRAESQRLLEDHFDAGRVRFHHRLRDDGGEQSSLRELIASADDELGQAGESAVQVLQDGEPLVVPDIATSPLLDEAARAHFIRRGIGAFVVVPLCKPEQPIFLLSVWMPAPRGWCPDEVALLGEMAERIWGASQRARTAVALRHSEERYRTLFESIEQGFCVFEVLFDDSGTAVDYRFIETNPAFARHTGLENAIGRTARELVPDLEPHWIALYGRVALTGTSHRFVQGSDALGRWFEVAASRVGDPAEHKVALLFNDITEARRAERALRDSEERFRTLADHMSQLAWMADESGRIFWYNRRWYDYTGASPAEMQRMGWAGVLHPDHVERVEQSLASAWASGEPVEDHFLLRRHDGQSRWFLSRVEPISEAGGERVRRWLGTATDVTEQYIAEQQLRESDRRKDEYLAMLGHELRNPLAAIHSATELVRIIRGEDSRLDHAIGVLQRQSSHMVRLVEGLLEVSRIARGKITLERSRLDLREVIANVVGDRAGEVALRGLRVSITSLSRPLWVLADRARMVQIFDNLLGNSLKFTQTGGRIDILLAAEDADAVVQFRDTGVGIRPDRLAEIFEPFHQEVQDADRAGGGLGLGLALAARLTQLHEGSLEARSEGLGRGAEFIVRLPSTTIDEVDPVSDEPVARDRGRSLALLVVEDNADAARMLCYVLQTQGHDVTIAPTAPYALDMLRQEMRDLVICDIGLPGMSGYDFARAVRGDPALQSIPLVAITGYGQTEDRRRSRDAGFDAHLVKPVEPEVLDELIERLVCGGT
jgi:PAS domain S-box-containing protein